MSSLERAGVAANRLKLEITESTLIADPVIARAVLRELDRLGIEISIDDFGTGYSSWRTWQICPYQRSRSTNHSSVE